MPNWSSKDERMYEHIKDNRLEQGVGQDRAKEIAARTVNKKRREEGRTSRSSSSKSHGGTSSGGRRSTREAVSRHGDREERTRQDLYEEAKRRGIQGRSTMNKGELARALGKKR